LHGLIDGSAAQIGVQVYAIAVSIAWTLVGAWAALKIVKATFGLRVSSDEEREGLDFTIHDQAIHQ
jgi:Amt family ammonium transporter